jgi:AcrR family transcriptional regulator
VAESPDRRERRKQRTRLAIRTAALDLFADHGYRDTTISDIAERADVAPRTVTLHFPTKEELLFDVEPFALDKLTHRLSSRRPDESALDALRDWMATTMTALESARAESDQRFWEQRALRARLITSEPELRGRARAGYYEFEQILAAAIGEDLGQTGNALIPRVAALTAVIGLRELYESDEARSLGSDPGVEDLLELVDRIIQFAGAGIDDATPPGKGHR